MPRPKKPAAEPKPAAAAKPAKPSRKAASEDEPEKESAYASEWERAAPENAKVMPILISDKYQTVEIPALEEFDPSTIKLDGTVVAIGKRRTGKSWAFRYIMHTLRKEFPAGIAISQTDEMNHFWRQYMPAKFIFDRYDPAIIEAVFARQKAILNDERYTEEEREKKARFFILLDDVISDPKLFNDPCLKKLFVMGRHFKLFILITTQYAKAISPTLRSNADYVFILHNKQELQRESLWRDFADFLTREAFYMIMDEYTEDNEILVVDTSEPTAKPWEVLKWFKAVDPGEFKLGSREYWETNYSRVPLPTPDAMPPMPKLTLPGENRV